MLDGKLAAAPAALAVWTPLSTADMEQAILARLESANRFGSERSSYIGASEAGDCPRRVADKKLHPEAHAITDPAAAGRIRGGSVLENEVVQMLRLSPLGKAIRATGANQAEIALEDAPIRVHPDGEITGLPIPAGLTHALVMDPDGNLLEIEVSSLEGPGVLEIKTFGLGAFSHLKKKGLSGGYRDQVQVQMGATGRKWALLVAAQRDDVSKVLIFFLRFDADRFEFLKEKARNIMAAVAQGVLPEADTECGFCDYCPLQNECPAHAVMAAEAGAVFPADAALEVDVLAEEYLALQPQEKRLKEVKEALKDLFSLHPVEAHVVADGDVSGAKCARAWTADRDTCDTKRLSTEFPAAYAATVSKSEPSMWVRVSAPKAQKGRK